jgi:hypothetical protein
MTTTVEGDYPGGLRTVFRLRALAVALPTVPVVLAPTARADPVGWPGADPTLVRLLGAVLPAVAVGSVAASRGRTCAGVRVSLVFETAVATAPVVAAGYEGPFGAAPAVVWVLVAVPGAFDPARAYYLVGEGRSPPSIGRPAN